MLNNITSENGKSNAYICSQIDCINEQIDDLDSRISTVASVAEDLDTSLTELKNKDSIDVSTGNITTLTSSTSNVSTANIADGNITNLKADNVEITKPIDELTITKAHISNLDGLTSIDGSLSINTLTSDTVNVSNISGSPKADNLTVSGDLEAKTVKSDSTIEGVDVSASTSISAPKATLDEITNKTLSTEEAAITNEKVEESSISTLTSDKTAIDSLSNSKFLSKDKATLSKYIALSNFNGTYKISGEGLDIKVDGQDGMYVVSFDNDDPSCLVNITASYENKGLVLELDDSLTNKQVDYSYSSTTEPLICYEANYTHSNCDKAVHSKNNLWSRHVVVVGQTSYSNGVEIAGCLHAECIKLDNPIIDNVLVTDSLSSYRNNCLGDIYVYPFEIADNCCSYGKIEVADKNPNECRENDTGCTYYYDTSTTKTIVDANQITINDVVEGARTEEDATTSGCTIATYTPVVTLDKTGLNVNNTTKVNETNVCTPLIDTNKIQDQSETKVLSTFDGTNWNTLSCGEIECAIKDGEGQNIVDRYVKCTDSPVNCVSKKTENGVTTTTISYICKDAESWNDEGQINDVKVLDCLNCNKCLSVSNNGKDDTLYGITEGLVREVNTETNNEITCIDVYKAGETDCKCYEIDTKAVLECSSLPSTVASKVYNVNQCTYAYTGSYLYLCGYCDSDLCYKIKVSNDNGYLRVSGNTYRLNTNCCNIVWRDGTTYVCCVVLDINTTHDYCIVGCNYLTGAVVCRTCMSDQLWDGCIFTISCANKVYSKDIELTTRADFDSLSVNCIHNDDCSTCVATLDSTVSVTGNTTIAGDITVTGNIYQNGSTYVTCAEDLQVNDCNITLRANATAAMASGETSGIVVNKYDGTNDLNIITDSAGTLRVGDSNDEKPVLLRDEEANLTDGYVLCWNADSKEAKTVAYNLRCGLCKLCLSNSNALSYSNFEGVGGLIPLTYIACCTSSLCICPDCASLHSGTNGVSVCSTCNSVLVDASSCITLYLNGSCPASVSLSRDSGVIICSTNNSCSTTFTVNNSDCLGWGHFTCCAAAAHLTGQTGSEVAAVPINGQMHLQLDGSIYVNEGNYPVAYVTSFDSSTGTLCLGSM